VATGSYSPLFTGFNGLKTPGFPNNPIKQNNIMRPDMYKVVIERPRWNPGPGKNNRRANLPDELRPKFEGIKRPHSWRAKA